MGDVVKLNADRFAVRRATAEEMRTEGWGAWIVEARHFSLDGEPVVITDAHTKREAQIEARRYNDLEDADLEDMSDEDENKRDQAGEGAMRR